MAVAFVGSTTASGQYAAAPAATLSGVGASDVQFACLAQADVGAVRTASGWTLIDSTTYASPAFRLSIFWRRGPGDFTANVPSGAGDWMVGIVAYSGLATSGNPYQGEAIATGSSAPSAAATSATTAVRFYGVSSGSRFTTATVTAPATIRIQTPGANGIDIGASDDSVSSTPAAAKVWAGGTNASAAVAATIVLNPYTNTPPNAPTLTAPANNATLDRNTPQQFALNPSDPDAGDSTSQTLWRYRIRDIGAAWTMVTQTSPNTFIVFPAGTFAAGNYEWQAATRDALGTPASDADLKWSASSFFTAATAPTGPTITSPTNGATIGVQNFDLVWSYPSQDAFQAQLLDGSGNVITDLGVTNNATTRAVSFGNIPNNVTRKAQVRVESGGLWSSYSAVTVTVSYTPPAAPTFTASSSNTAATVTLAITNPTPGTGVPATSYNDVYVRTAASSLVADTYRPYSSTGTRIATQLATNASYVDRTPASGPNVTYEYRVRAVASNGTTTDSGWVTP